MKKNILAILFMLVGSLVYGQSAGMSDQQILTSISNLPAPFVEMVSSKISTLDNFAKDSLMLLSEERTEVNSAIKSKTFHENFHNWMETYFTEEEINGTMSEMAPSFNKSSN